MSKIIKKNEINEGILVKKRELIKKELRVTRKSILVNRSYGVPHEK